MVVLVAPSQLSSVLRPHPLPQPPLMMQAARRPLVMQDLGHLMEATVEAALQQRQQTRATPLPLPMPAVNLLPMLVASPPLLMPGPLTLEVHRLRPTLEVRKPLPMQVAPKAPPV